MHINRKRQSDSQTALDAQSSAQKAQPTRRTFGAFSLQRVALACFGVLGTAGLLVLAGCPANLEDPQRFDQAGGASAGGASAGGGTASTGVDFTAANKLFVASCATSAICHMAGSTTGLDLVSTGLEQRLVNVTSVNPLAGVTDCPSTKLIDTAMPTKSWLLSKVTPGAFGDCGSLMPFGGTALSAADLATITKLVNDEAAAAGGTTPPAGSAGAAAAGGAATGTGGAATAGSGGM